MADESVTLAGLYKGWDRYQDLLVQTVEPLTDEQLAWRAAPNLRSAGELVAHIVGCRAGWFYYVLNEREEVLAEISKWDEPGATAPGASELVRGLQTTWQIIQNGLQRWSLADLDTEFQDDDDGVERTFTRQWVLWHLLEHDMHHGGEFSYVLGMHGREGMDI
jgi:uncharacterized damage-inducible protein DinB